LRSIHPQEGKYGEPPTYDQSSTQYDMATTEPPSTEPIFTDENQTIKMISVLFKDYTKHNK
jgi:hypothetical protein